VGRALRGAEEGDRVVLDAPGGKTHLTILEVSYERIEVEPFREPLGAESTNKRQPRPAVPPPSET
jgi:transcription elongation factor GreB